MVVVIMIVVIRLFLRIKIYFCLFLSVRLAFRSKAKRTLSQRICPKLKFPSLRTAACESAKWCAIVCLAKILYDLLL